MIHAISGVDNVQIYENSFKTQTERKMIIDDKPSDEKILSQIKTDLENGLNVSVNCASKKLAEKIFILGKSLGKSTAKFTGENNEVFEQFNVTQTMGKHKESQLSDPNQYWK